MRMAAWVILVLLATVAAAVAQPVGEVESVGFNNVYRAGCWTPMVVRIKPNGASSGTYQVQVKQRDGDNDTAIFTRNITLTGSEAGGRDQRFWMYFIPEPVGGGLPSARQGASLKEIQDRLEVYLCNEDGKQLSQLPVTAVPDAIDPPKGIDGRRGVRMVVVVNDGGSRVSWSEYADGLADRAALLGVLEDVAFINVRVRDLPENVLAYDSVDAVLWLDSDPGQLRQDGGARLAALEAYVRGGGHLVISQTPNWQQTLAFGELLPVKPEAVVDRPDPEPLRSLARRGTQGRSERNLPAGWNALGGPFRIVVATPRAGTLVEQWMTLPDLPGRHPFLARKVVGAGAVTWVAQDLGDPALTGLAKTGWLNIWDHVFGWENEPIVGKSATDQEKERYAASPAMDVGVALNRFEDKTQVGLFITLAVVFFVLYWLLAGPGVFLYLASRGRSQYSWYAFAAAAVVATLLTVLIVRLVLRGPPRLDHLTVVRGSAAEADVRSRFAVYIPRDGEQTLQLTQEPAPGTVSVVAPLPLHPAHLANEVESTGKLSYTVQVREPTSDGKAKIAVPYRSTLKQFESRWSGEVEGRIEGVATVNPNVLGGIEGRLTNGTGRDLRDMYIAYRIPTSGRWQNWMLYLPEWKSGVTIDLVRERFGDRNTEGGKPSARTPGVDGAAPHGAVNLFGEIGIDWRDYWLTELSQRVRTGLGDGVWDDATGVRRALPMLTYFDALRPAFTDTTRSRVELLRRGARHMNLSPALAAGALVVVAEAVDTPQPGGVEVEGDLTPGKGRTVYQFVLPTNRPATADEPESVEQPAGGGQ